MSAAVGKAELNPGESTELRAKGKEMMPGSFTAYVELHTNQPDTPILKIPVRGYLEQPVGFERPTTLYENILPGQTLEWAVGLDVPPTIRPEHLSVQISGTGPLEAKIEQRSSNQYVLTLRWRGAREPGWKRYRVEVFDGPKEGAAVAPFHVAIQVVPELEIFPASLFISGKDWESGWTRKIECTFHRPFTGDWKVAWSDDRIGALICTTCNSNAGGLKIMLAAGPSKAPPKGDHSLRLLAADGGRYELQLISEAASQVPPVSQPVRQATSTAKP
jgi:hypothetical protein